MTESIIKTIIEDVNSTKARIGVFSDEPLRVTLTESAELEALKPRFRTDLINVQPGREGHVSTVHLRAVPRRGESIEYQCPKTGEARLFRVMDVVHTEDGLRMHGHVAKSLSANPI